MIIDILILAGYAILAVICPILALRLYRYSLIYLSTLREFQKIDLGFLNLKSKKFKNHEAACRLRSKIENGNTTIIFCGYDFDNSCENFDQFIRTLISIEPDKSTLIVDFCPESTAALGHGISSLDLILKSDDVKAEPIVEIEKNLHYSSALIDNLSSPIPQKRLVDFINIVDETYDNIVFITAIHKRFQLIETALNASRNTIFYSANTRSLSRYIYIKDILRSTSKQPYLVKI